MPQWEGIEDASAKAAPVWFQRCCDGTFAVDGSKTPSTAAAAAASSPRGSSWKPLRKTDCQALNDTLQKSGNTDPSVRVSVDGGRATAQPAEQRLEYNFCKSPPSVLDYATWFIVPEDKQHREEHGLDPIFHKGDTALIEEFYQEALQSSSSLGKGVASVLERTPLVLHDESKVKIVQSTDGKLVVKRTPKSSSWFSHSSQTLQRGYGEYKVVGEEIETQLGPNVQHLVFVVHGIGEAFISREDTMSLPSHRETIEQARLAIQEKQYQHWQQQCAAAKKQKSGVVPPPPGRIEFVAIEWFDELHDASSSLMKSLRATTLQTIPALRAIANDVVFDVLMYLTPAFCQAVLESVTSQLCQYHAKFLQIHPDFVKKGGRCSLIGHSLGSVICWDLLCVLKDAQEKDAGASGISSNKDGLNVSGVSVESQDSSNAVVGYQACAAASSPNKIHQPSANGTYGPSVKKAIERRIPFRPEATIFLGSPLGIFLTLRGAHGVFEEMRQQQEPTIPDDLSSIPQTSPFSLPTERLFNIYHPSDPVAYRIEPLLLDPNLNPDHDLPPPLYLTAPGKQVRLDLKAKQLGDEIRKSFLDQKSSWNSLISSAVTALATDVQAKEAPGAAIQSKKKREDTGSLHFALGGKNSRVDFSLQPGVIHNEYIRYVVMRCIHGDYCFGPSHGEPLIHLIVLLFLLS